MLAQLQWPIQITTAEKEFGRANRNLSSEVQYYHVGLPMSIFGYCIICMQLYTTCGADGSIRQPRFRISLLLLPDLWHRCNCLVEKQSAVGSLVFA